MIYVFKNITSDPVFKHGRFVAPGETIIIETTIKLDDAIAIAENETKQTDKKLKAVLNQSYKDLLQSLKDLSVIELQKIAVLEKNGKNRKTLLNLINRKQRNFQPPIKAGSYDGLRSP